MTPPTAPSATPRSDAMTDAELLTVSDEELSRAVLLFHELDVRRKQYGLTTANMLRVIIASVLAPCLASHPDDRSDSELMDFAQQHYSSAYIGERGGVIIRLVLPPDAKVCGDIRKDLRAAARLASPGEDHE